MSEGVDKKKKAVEYMIVCPMCGKWHSVKMSKEEAEAYDDMVAARKEGRPSRLIQEVLPNLSKEERESLITGYCPACQKMIFDGGDSWYAADDE